MAQRIEGTVVSIDGQGNLVTDIPIDRLAAAPRDASVTVRCDEHATQCLFDADHGQPDFTLVALLGASGFLELAIVGDSAKIMLGVGAGEKVVVEW